MSENAQAPEYPFDEELATAIPFLPELDFGDIPAARDAADELAAVAPLVDLTEVTYEDVQIPVSGGGTIMLRITTPDAGQRPLPVIYDVHPGGFCLGSPSDVHPRNVVLAREVSAIVIAADYRLAPEHPYPTPLEDYDAGLSWIAEHAQALGADADRIAVYGQSGGGGLAAGLALLARDRGTPAICFQYLAFPELDDRLETASMKRFVDTPLFSRPNAAASWQHYLGQLVPGSPDVPVYAAPARETDLAGLPRTYLGVMQFDPLRDEGIAYAQKLLEADVSVELHLFPSTFHYSRAIADAEVSQREMAEEVSVLRRGLYGVAPTKTASPTSDL